MTITNSPFQWVVDNAADLLINKRAVVAQTTTRDQTVRGASRGGQIWRFTINPGYGHLWSEIRSNIEAMDAADKFTPGLVNFGNNPNLSYMFGYQGNATSLSGFTANIVQGNSTITVNGGTITSGNILVSGDLVQFSGSNRVYSVVNNVPYNSHTVLLNRPVLEANATSVGTTVGSNCNFAIVCTQFPDWRFANDGSRRIEWTSPFIFMESLSS